MAFSDTDPKGHKSKSISKLSHLKPQIFSEPVKALTFAIPVGLHWVFCVFVKKTAEKELKSKTEQESGLESHISDH